MWTTPVVLPVAIKLHRSDADVLVVQPRLRVCFELTSSWAGLERRGVSRLKDRLGRAGVNIDSEFSFPSLIAAIGKLAATALKALTKLDLMELVHPSPSSASPL